VIKTTAWLGCYRRLKRPNEEKGEMKIIDRVLKLR